MSSFTFLDRGVVPLLKHPRAADVPGTLPQEYRVPPQASKCSWNGSSSSTSSTSAFHSRRLSRVVSTTAQGEQLSQLMYDRRNLPVEAQLLSLGAARPRDMRHQGIPELDDELPELSQVLAVPVAPTTGQAGWLMNAQRAPAGAYNASVALESQLQNRGLVAHQRALQAGWVPAGPYRPPTVVADPHSESQITAGPASASDLGPSPHAQWIRAYQPNNSSAFNQSAGARGRA